MTLSEAIARWELTAKAELTGTNIDGSGTIGSRSYQRFPDANIAYSFKIVSDANGDVATLNLTSGVVEQTSGFPAISDGDGKDLAGESLPTLSTLYALLLEKANSSGADTIAFDALSLPEGGINEDEVVIPYIIKNGASAPLGTVAWYFGAANVELTVTVVGKS